MKDREVFAMTDTPASMFSKRGIRQNRILELLRELDKAGMITRTHGGASRLSDAKRPRWTPFV